MNLERSLFQRQSSTLHVFEPSMKRLLAFAAVVGVAAALWFGRGRIVGGAADFLVVSDPLKPADLIQILGGGEERVGYAVELYRKGLGKKLLFTGNSPDHGPSAKLFHTSANRVLSQGIPATAILDLHSQATTTYGEAAELRQVLSAHPEIRRVLVVTSPYHSRRARSIFRREIPAGVDLRMATVPVEKINLAGRWWNNRQVRTSAWLEYRKTLLDLFILSFLRAKTVESIWEKWFLRKGKKSAKDSKQLHWAYGG
jgi:uncharacterized SAM-binding protein YcdF (DUF218 family)